MVRVYRVAVAIVWTAAGAVAACDRPTAVGDETPIARTEVFDCPEEHPDCKGSAPISQDGRLFVSNALAHIDRYKDARCDYMYRAIEDVLTNDSLLGQWDNELTFVDSAGNTIGILGDQHGGGADDGEIHLWSGLWDGRVQQRTSRNPIWTVMHEGVHRHYYSLGDLTDHHTEIAFLESYCFVGDAWSKTPAPDAKRAGRRNIPDFWRY